MYFYRYIIIYIIDILKTSALTNNYRYHDIIESKIFIFFHLILYITVLIYRCHTKKRVETVTYIYNAQ